MNTKQYSLFDLEPVDRSIHTTIANDCDDTSDIDLIWEKFKIYIEKLRKEGCNSIDKEWWKYRYGEFLKIYEKAKDDKDWAEKTRKYSLWEKLFEKYKSQIITKLTIHHFIAIFDYGDDNSGKIMWDRFTKHYNYSVTDFEEGLCEIDRNKWDKYFR